MGKDSGIQWTHHTFNPWRGCARVSEGCRHCYAETLSKRNPATLGVWGPGGTRVVAAESMWRQPLKWDREAREAGERRRVFCASLADVFEDWPGFMVNSQGRTLHVTASDEWKPGPLRDGRECGFTPVTMEHARRRLARLIWDTPNLDYLLLTKRIENAREMIYRMWFPDAEWPRNYWLGATVENQAARSRIDVLREIEAPLRFLSVEPLLEDLGEIDLGGISWVIVGGESGPHARPFDLAWARSIRDQCRSAGVPFFLKQLGASPIDSAIPRNWTNATSRDSHCQSVPLQDAHGGDPDEWPADLRVREFPAPEAVHA